MLEFYSSSGIVHQEVVSSPQQNGCVERKHQLFLNIAQGLLFQEKFPKKFWSYQCDMQSEEIIALESNGTWRTVDIPVGIYKIKIYADGSSKRYKAHIEANCKRVYTTRRTRLL